MTTHVHSDRAAAVTTAILRLIRSALLDWLHHEHVNMGDVRDAIKSLLRDELADMARQIVADRGDAS